MAYDKELNEDEDPVQAIRNSLGKAKARLDREEQDESKMIDDLKEEVGVSTSSGSIQSDVSSDDNSDNSNSNSSDPQDGDKNASANTSTANEDKNTNTIYDNSSSE